jgi:hypothetical protein
VSDQEQIARRAYEISQSEESGSDEDNWRRAEEELRSGQTGEPWAKTSSGNADSITVDS